MAFHFTATRWHKKRLWAGIVAYWFISGTGAALIEQAGLPLAPHWKVLVLLLFLSMCMVTARGWKIWQRTAYVLAALFLEPIFEIPAFLAIGRTLYMAGRGDVIDPAVSLMASLPLVIFAMRQSQLFLRPSTDTANGIME